jgi:hypothetical protein
MEPESNWPALSALFGVNTIPFIISCSYYGDSTITLKWIGVNTISDYEYSIDQSDFDNIVGPKQNTKFYTATIGQEEIKLGDIICVRVRVKNASSSNQWIGTVSTIS